MKRMFTSRRTFVAAAAGAVAVTALPPIAKARAPLEISWDDLIPPGVPYAQIIGQGEIDEINDTWKPEYDENAQRFNRELDGRLVRLPGYIIPIDLTSKGVTSFVLVPYVGACIHVPPPPPNQLVFVNSKDPWPSEALWDAVFVSGVLRTRMQSTAVAEIGYALEAKNIEAFEWE